MKRAPITPVQADAQRTHNAFRFLLGSWSFTALVMLAASIAALLLMTGCGGGGDVPEPDAPVLLATTTSNAQGGNSAQGAALVAAPLLGPTVSLTAPTTVQVVVHTTWVQQFFGTAELMFSVTPGTAAATPAAEHSAGLGQAPAGTFTATTTWCGPLPAGTHTLQAVARPRAANSAGTPSAVLGALVITSEWEVNAVNPSACGGVQQ